MINYVYRFVIAFCTVAVAYYLYATVVVPLIDTNITRKKIETQQPSETSNQRYDQLITEIFPEDDWIRDRCKILDAKQSILFFKEAKQLEDGNWEVRPFTMFLNPDEALVDSNTPGRKPPEKPIILRTEEGAFIKFEDGTSSNSPNGKFAGARMPGKVVVIREESTQGAEDNFRFETRNIQVNTKQILAVNPVQFEYGKHYGKGHNLTINLATRRKKPGASKQRVPLVRNLKTVELAHLDEIMLMPSPKKSVEAKTTRLPDAKNSRADQLGDRMAKSPVRVTCTGPFRLDFGKSKMVLFDQIHVEQLHREDPHDHLYCDRLEILFKLREELAKNNSAADQVGSDIPSTSSDKLELRNVIAFGAPARLLIDSRNAFAQAEQINYHIGRRIVHCKQDVILKDGDHEFRAPEMEYKLTLNNQLGTGWATGPGQIIGYPDNPEKVFKATWQSEFNVQPHEGKKAVSLHGNAQIVFQNEKHFHCQELHFWIWEKRKRGPKPKWDFYPAQMLGLRDVTLTAPEFAGSVDEVRVFWPQPIGVIPRNPRLNDPKSRTTNKRGQNGKLASHPNAASGQANSVNDAERADKKEPVENRIIGNGRLATAYLSRKNELESFRFEGDPIPNDQEAGSITNGSNAGNRKVVHVQSLDLTPTIHGKPPKLLIDVKGTDIQVDSTKKKDAYKVSVRGFPAAVEAEGVKFLAPILTVDQSTNMAWSDVAGQVEISPTIQAEQRPIGPEPKTKIYWNKSFKFDGLAQKLELDDDVRFEGLDYLESGEQVTFEGSTKRLAARTNRKVNFNKSKSFAQKTKKSNPLKIQELAMLESAYIKATTRETINEIKSIDEIRATEINLRTDTGDARALGPGSIRSIRREKNKKDGDSSSLLSGVSGNEQGGEKKGHSYLGIAFQGEITGNVKSRQGTISNNIRAVFGPAKDWNVRYDPDATSIFGEEIYLNCDQMKFSQWKPVRSQRPLLELSAIGNTELEGKKFRALASQLTYTEENEVVQLEGLQRTNARIWFRKSELQPWQYVEARKLRYQQANGEIVGSEDLKEMRLLQFEAPNKRRR